MSALVSVITPTWQRHDVLLHRCIPSVQAQTYPGIEHIIVPDGPDPLLEERLLNAETSGAIRPEYLLRPLDTHHGKWGGPGRRYGARLATGDYIAYLDDDDAYRPDHVALLAQALTGHPEVGFAYSWMVANMPGGGRLRYSGPPAYMSGTPMIMHRRELLDIANWGGSIDEDTVLMRAWIDAGIDYGEVGVVTVDVYPGPATTAAIMADPNIAGLDWE